MMFSNYYVNIQVTYMRKFFLMFLLGSAALLSYAQEAVSDEPMGYSAMSLNYGSFYNWKVGEGLMVKVGGGLDISGDMISNLIHSTNDSHLCRGQEQRQGHNS